MESPEVRIAEKCILKGWSTYVREVVNPFLCCTDARTTVVSQPLGIVMVTMTAVTARTSLQNTVNRREELASVICLLVITATVYLVFTSVTVTMTVWITPMKTKDINAVSNLILLCTKKYSS